MKYLVMYLLPVILVLFMGSSILSANSAFGLSCDATNMTWSFEETDAIFLGKALSKEYQPNPIHEDRFDAVTLFSIIEPYKGIYQKEISIISSEWLWGVNFTENSDYVVFANNNDGMFEHALCTPTLLASESNMLEIQKISQRYILPPLVQSELGVSSNEVQCKQNLVLIQKYDGSPACVTESTKTKLIDRGWTETDKSQIRKPVSVPTPADPMSITINGGSTSLVIPINTGETKEIDILLEPKTPIISSTVSVESYFGSAGDCNEIDTTSYCPGRGIDMILSDTTITSQKEITLTIKVPVNTTSGTYAYLIKTDTIVESLYPDQVGTIGKFIRFDLKVE